MTDNTSLLSDLIQVSRDSKEFYDDVIPATRDARLRDIFSRMSAAKGAMIEGLSGKMINLGGEPPREGTFVGSLRKAFSDVRASFSSNEDKVYVGQLEETEDRILEHFESALKETDSPELREVLTAHLPRVRACHDEMRALKQSMGA